MSRRIDRSIAIRSPRRSIATGGILVMTFGMLPWAAPRIAHGAAARQPVARSVAALTAAGRGNRTTRAVTIPGRWSVHWSYNCSGEPHRFQVAAYRRGQHAPLAQVARHGYTEHGVLKVRHGGKVHLVIRSPCAWHVKITRTVARSSAPAATPTATATPGPTATATASPTATSTATVTNVLALHVSGNELINQQGQAIRLIGVNVPASAQCIPTGPHTPPGIFAFPSVAQTAAAVAGWHANVARITINEDCWLGINGGNPAYTGQTYRTAIAGFITALHADGIYTIIDLHANAPGSTPSTSQQVMADADHAIAYWTSVAETFKNDPAVILEPYNEPHITTSNAQTTNPWQCWRDGCLVDELDQYHNTPVPGAAPWQAAGMQSLVDAIRATGATNPILIDGLNWSQDLTHLLLYLPADPLHQLIADYHNYMSPGAKNTPAYWDAVVAPITDKMPMMTSEFGEKDCGSTYVTQYMQWADAHNVSYIPWVWMTWDCSAMGLVSGWDGTPSAYGQVFYDHFHAASVS